MSINETLLTVIYKFKRFVSFRNGKEWRPLFIEKSLNYQEISLLVLVDPIQSKNRFC